MRPAQWKHREGAPDTAKAGLCSMHNMATYQGAVSQQNLQRRWLAPAHQQPPWCWRRRPRPLSRHTESNGLHTSVSSPSTSPPNRFGTYGHDTLMCVKLVDTKSKCRQQTHQSAGCNICEVTHCHGLCEQHPFAPVSKSHKRHGVRLIRASANSAATSRSLP